MCVLGDQKDGPFEEVFFSNHNILLAISSKNTRLHPVVVFVFKVPPTA